MVRRGRWASERVVTESPLVRRLLIGTAMVFLTVFLFVPLVAVFVNALRAGVGAYATSVADQGTRQAIGLTLLVAAIAVPLNLVFGLAAAWLIAKFSFRGKGAMVTLIDLPFSISPVIAGLVFVLLFGRQGMLGPWLLGRGVQIVFAVPGIVLATIFVTLPFIAREVLAQMQTQGSEEEEAALTLGAGGWRMFWSITVPKVRWSLLYGIVLCNARAMGEFGAVSVVSGHIRGETITVPLQVEILYNEYQFVAAFAVASLLTLLALLTLAARRFVEARSAR
ncbi:MAG: sulfate ABC transporter permease subunit CysW [Myxococcales bacterium]|jgi:sulfate transport system permease protein